MTPPRWRRAPDHGSRRLYHSLQHHGPLSRAGEFRPVPRRSPVGNLPPYPQPAKKAVPSRPGGCTRPRLKNRPSPALPIAPIHRTRSPRSSRCAPLAATQASHFRNGCLADPPPCRAIPRVHPPWCRLPETAIVPEALEPVRTWLDQQRALWEFSARPILTGLAEGPARVTDLAGPTGLRLPTVPADERLNAALVGNITMNKQDAWAEFALEGAAPSVLTSPTTTLAPSRTSASTAARPMLPTAPVNITRFPSTLPVIFFPFDP